MARIARKYIEALEVALDQLELCAMGDDGQDTDLHDAVKQTRRALRDAKRKPKRR